jgi:hypothetical protein
MDLVLFDTPEHTHARTNAPHENGTMHAHAQAFLPTHIAPVDMAESLSNHIQGMALPTPVKLVKPSRTSYQKSGGADVGR